MTLSTLFSLKFNSQDVFTVWSLSLVLLLVSSGNEYKQPNICISCKFYFLNSSCCYCPLQKRRPDWMTINVIVPGPVSPPYSAAPVYRDQRTEHYSLCQSSKPKKPQPLNQCFIKIFHRGRIPSVAKIPSVHRIPKSILWSLGMNKEHLIYLHLVNVVPSHRFPWSYSSANQNHSPGSVLLPKSTPTLNANVCYDGFSRKTSLCLH